MCRDQVHWMKVAGGVVVVLHIMLELFTYWNVETKRVVAFNVARTLQQATHCKVRSAQ